MIVYICYLFALVAPVITLGGFALLAPVIAPCGLFFAYVSRGQDADADSHFDFQIRIFWLGLLFLVAVGLLACVIIGIIGVFAFFPIMFIAMFGGGVSTDEIISGLLAHHGGLRALVIGWFVLLGLWYVWMLTRCISGLKLVNAGRPVSKVGPFGFIAKYDFVL